MTPVTFPVNEEKNLYEKNKLALQGEVSPGARATLSAPEPLEDPSSAMTPAQRIKFNWVQGRLREAEHVLPAQQWAQLIDALPDALVVGWACGRARLPAWAKHHLEKLDERRKAGQLAPGQPALALPINGDRQENAA